MIQIMNSQENFIMRCLNSISFIFFHLIRTLPPRLRSTYSRLMLPDPKYVLSLASQPKGQWRGQCGPQSPSLQKPCKSSIAHRTQRLLSAAILFLMFSSLRIEKNFLEQVIEIYFTYNSYIINNMDNIIESIYLILTLPPHLLRNNYIPPQRHVLPIPWYSP